MASAQVEDHEQVENYEQAEDNEQVEDYIFRQLTYTWTDDKYNNDRYTKDVDHLIFIF